MLNIILAIHPDLHLYFTNMVKMQIQLFAVSFILRPGFFSKCFCLDMDGRYVYECGDRFVYVMYI
jgi:hypothetical protein